MHGYALVKHIKQVSDNLLQVEEGSLYPALQRMLREGFLNRKKALPRKAVPRAFTASLMRAFAIWSRKSVSFEKMFAGITRVLAFDQA